MIIRRLPMLAVSVVALGAIGLTARQTPDDAPASFGPPPQPWMPATPPPGRLTDTWFCPGVPATAAEGVGGSVVIANSGSAPLSGRITLLAGPGQAVEQSVDVPAYDSVTIDVAAAVTAPMVSAMVELDGDGGVVEQRAVHPAGETVGAAVAPCTTDTSGEWYLAEGFTAGGSTEALVLTNPYDEVAIVDIGFATAAGSRQPQQLQGTPIPARSVVVIDLASIAARDEAEVAISVNATFGSLVVGRSQVYAGEDRLGYGMALAAPALRSQWWFANGDKGPAVTERFSIYNPTETDAEVQVTFLGIPRGTDLIDPIVVPARQVVTYTSDDVASLAEGRHAVVFSTTDLSQSIVVERVITRTIEEIPTTSVVLGAVSRPADGFVADAWTTVIGPGEATADALVVYNIDGADATVTVQAVTPSGIVTVPSLAELALPAGGLITIPLTEPDVLDNQLLIRSTSRVFVERSLPRESGAQGRVGSWAIPAPD